MSLTPFLLERALKALNLPEASLRQIQIAAKLGNVDGRGFPKELFELSAPVIARGLLNFSILQMHQDWVYPYWVHQQLDPASESFVPRSQNPLLINITNRSWTTLGSPSGLHEAIVDPRGLLTPLPREWSVDVWLMEGEDIFFPSLSNECDQKFDARAPLVTTTFPWRGLRFSTECFVGTIRGGRDVLFARVTVHNTSEESRVVQVVVAVRPFGPEGIAPIGSISLKSNKILMVDGSAGVVFEKVPHALFAGNAAQGDVARRIVPSSMNSASAMGASSIVCSNGLATAAALFELALPHAQHKSVAYSLALGDKKSLQSSREKTTWRVSFEKRRKEQQEVWKKELALSASFGFADKRVQELFDASRATLLQLTDHEFISPGPYLYHRFWFRDAAPMVRALDVLGYHTKTRAVINGFQKYLTGDGFFQAPDGEWDSNGAVLWTVAQHFRLTQSLLWLRKLHPVLRKGAQWIAQKRKTSSHSAGEVPGLMPKSLSAEHLGTIDQYYWDSFWSLAGLESYAWLCQVLGSEREAATFSREAFELREALVASFEMVRERDGEGLIPAAPSRPFDHSAIGSICCLYPLELLDRTNDYAAATVRAIVHRFVDDRGFYHPIIHSGYNPYLTLQLAQCLLQLGEVDQAWDIAQSMFEQASQTYSYPEAIHPRTRSGAMGDGHHGWAAAEVLLFLRNSMIKETEGGLRLFAGASSRVLKRGTNLVIEDAPTSFGRVTASVEFTSTTLCELRVRTEGGTAQIPSFLDVELPWHLVKASPSNPHQLVSAERSPRGSRLRIAARASTVLITLK
jgi:hypothetical protein